MFDGDQDVGAALGEVEAKERLACSASACTSTPSRSTAFSSWRSAWISPTASLASVVWVSPPGCCEAVGHTKALGAEAHLSDERRCARSVLSDGAPQRFAVTHQGVELLGHTRLGRHSVAQQGFKPGHVQLRQQQPEGRVRW